MSFTKIFSRTTKNLKITMSNSARNAQIVDANTNFSFGERLLEFMPKEMNKSEFSRALGMSHLNSLRYASQQPNGNLDHARTVCNLYPVPLWTFFVPDFSPQKMGDKIEMIQSNLITNSSVGDISYSGVSVNKSERYQEDNKRLMKEIDRLKLENLELRKEKDTLFKLLGKLT